MVFPLFEDLPPQARLAALAKFAPQQSLEVMERLEDLVVNPGAWNSAWTRATAIHALGSRGRKEALAIIETNLEAPEPLLRETALWALDRLGWTTAERLEPFLGDAAPNVARLADALLLANATNSTDPVDPATRTQKGDSHADDD